MRRRFSLILTILVIPLTVMVGGPSGTAGAQGSTGTFHIFLLLAIDQSGSMSTNDEQGWRFDAAKFLIGALDEGDEVAVFTFAARTTPVVADSPPKIIGGTEDKLALWRTIDDLRLDRAQATTNMLELFEGLDRYIGNLSSRAQTQTILVLLTDGQDYADDSCRSGAPASDAANCGQHRKQAQEKGQTVRENAIKRYQDERLGKAFTFLPIALKGPIADYDLDFLASISGLAKDQIPEASSKTLIETFQNQIVGRMLDRVAISGVETERRGIYAFKIPEGARSLTFATTGTKSQSGQTLPVWHPTPDKSVSAPASCNEVEGGCLAVVPEPSAGDWWVEQQGGGGVAPQALLRFDLDLVAAPAILPAGKPVSATIDLRNRVSGRSLLDAGYWRIAPASISAASLPSFTAKDKPEGVRLPGEIKVKKGDAEFNWGIEALAWPGLVDRSSLAPLEAEYRLAPGDTIPLVVAVPAPPDSGFQMGEVIAHLELGKQAKDVTMRPDGKGYYKADLDVLALLGEGDEGNLRISYEVRGARYQGFTYPADWWRVQEPNSPTIVRVRNRVTVEPASVDFGWLRRRDAQTQVPVTLRCEQCERGTEIPLKLEIANWQSPSDTSLSLDPLVLQVREPLKPGEQREVTLDLSGIVSSLPEVQASGYGSFSVTGGRVPVDVKPSQFTIHVDNRPELQRLWQDEKLRLFALGLFGTGWAFYGWEAPYLWVLTPVILCLVLLALTLSLFSRHRQWALWAPLAFVTGGGSVLAGLTVVRLIRGAPHFSYDLEWGSGENLPDSIHTAGVAPLDFTLSNDPAAQFYQTLPPSTSFSLVYARLSQERGAVHLHGMRGTLICEEGETPASEPVTMLLGKRYFLLPPGAGSGTSGLDNAADDWGLNSPAADNWESGPGSASGTMSRRDDVAPTTGENALWLRLSPEESAEEGDTATDMFTDSSNF